MIPKLESCVSALRSGVRARAHPRRPAARTRCCSSSSPAKASERWCTHERLRSRRARSARRRARHADLRPAAGRVRARRGHASCGTARASEYLDFLGGLAVTSLGHAHPEVADAIADQARTLLHVSNLYYNDVQPRVAARLDALLGGGGRVFFANSGAEANECAIKLARRYGQTHGGPERYHVISAYGSFHGRTLTTLAATGQPQKQETFQPLPDGLPPGRVRRPRRARGRDGRPRRRGACSKRCRARAASYPASAEYLHGVRRLCDEREALLIIDEVQMRARPHRQVVRVRARRRRSPTSSRWRRRSATACRSARAGRAPTSRPRSRPATTPRRSAASRSRRAPRSPCSTVMEREDVPDRARARRRALAEALPKVDGVADVRGAGLLIAAELAPGLDAKAVAQRCLDAGLVVNAVTPTALRLAPSLLVTDAEIDEAVAIVARRVPRREAIVSRSFLEVDDLDPGAARARSSTARSRGRPIPPRFRRCSRARASPRCSRSRRPAPASRSRWRSRRSAGTRSTCAARRSGSTRARSVEDVARTMAGMCAADRGAGVRPPRRSSGWRARRRRPDRQPAVRSCASVPGARRPADAPRALRATSRACRVAYVGDGNNVAASLAFGAALSGVELVVASPEGYELDADVVDRARNLGGTIERQRAIRTKRCAAPTSVYTDVWTSMGQEDEREQRLHAFAGFTVDDALMKAARDRRRVPALPARAPRRGGRGRGDRRPAVAGVAAGREPDARGARAARRPRARTATDGRRSGKPQRQHRILRVLEDQPVSSQAPARAAARGRRHRRDAGDREPRPRGARRGEGADPRRRDGVRDSRRQPRARAVRRSSEAADGRVRRRGLAQRRTSSCCARRPAARTWSRRRSTGRRCPTRLGTVAGDDTVLVVCTESVGGDAVAARLAALAGL